MAGRTGKTWLECNNPEMSDHFLRLAIKVTEVNSELQKSYGPRSVHKNVCDVGIGSERHDVGFTWEKTRPSVLAPIKQNSPVFPLVKMTVQVD